MSLDELRLAHPRPTLVRETFWSITGDVPFAWEHERAPGARPGVPAELDRRITLPFPPESAASGLEVSHVSGTLWYELEIPAAAVEAARQEGQLLLLHLDGVYGSTRVWVQGELAGTGERGYTRQTFDLARWSGAAGPLTATVEVEVDHSDSSRPRGKQDWQQDPHAIWYRRSSGIWRDVWVEVAPATHVVDVVTTTQLDTDSVTVELVLNRAAPPRTEARVELSLDGQVLTAATVAVRGRRTSVRLPLTELTNEHERASLLWAPEHPNLVDITVDLATGAGNDLVSAYAGLRETAVRGGAYVLNNRAYYFRAVLEQYYWPASHFTAPSDEARVHEVELIKALGFNGVRVHQVSADPRFLYWCDRMGLLAWGEMPTAYRFDAEAVRRTAEEWTAIVEQARAHPCVAVWVPFNESWGVHALETSPAQRALVLGVTSLTRALDPSRPVISNDGWEHLDSDLLTFHHYAQEGEKLGGLLADRQWLDVASGEHPFVGRRAIVSRGQRMDVPIMLTEFGGTTYRTGGTEEVWGYGVVDSAPAFEERLREIIGAVNRSPSLAGWCYTQLTDTLQEANGLLDEDRRPKIPIDTLREIITGDIQPDQ